MTRFRKALMAAIAVPVLGFGAAYAQAPAMSDTDSMKDPMKDSAKPAAPAADPMKVKEDEVLNKLHHANLMEIEMSRLALANSQTAKVKSLAERIIKDHTKADEKVTQMAQKVGCNLMAPEAMANMDPAAMPEMQAEMAQMDELKSVKGVDFDSKFLAAMTQGHDKAIAMVEQAKGELKGSKVESLLNGLEPTLKEHRKMVLKLEKGPSKARRARPMP